MKTPSIINIFKIILVRIYSFFLKKYLYFDDDLINKYINSKNIIIIFFNHREEF
jgi:hypothetical protein